MKAAEDLIPWKVTDISIRPYEGFWSMNPCIHFDGQLWRCVLRCCDYAMPDGITIRSKNARVVGQQTKNAMVILDPQTWQAVEIFKMHEKDSFPRQPCPHMGYEDMRIFSTDKGGLQGIAASLHLSRRDEELRAIEGIPQHQPPEQVLLSFDESYDIVDAHPIRGDGWSGTPQKNWVPFDQSAEPRFLYSIDKGTMFGDEGRLRSEDARVRPSSRARSVPPSVPPTTLPPVERLSSAPDEMAAQVPELTPEIRADGDSRGSDDRPSRKKRHERKPMIRGSDVRMVRGGRVKLDTMSSRPSSRPSPRSSRSSSRSSRPVPARTSDDSMRVMGGRMLHTYNGLRGGSQLVRIADDAWLGIGHEMKFLSGKKHYWHTFYVVDARGKMTRVSEPMKLAPNGIEFAAGMAIDGDRVVVSFGVDDMECRLGETKLSAVMEILRPIGR